MPTKAARPSEVIRQHDEPVPVAAAHDLKLPSAGAGDGGLHLLPLIAGVADDALDKREAPSSLAEQSLGAVAVLYAGGGDLDGQQQANRIRQNVALAAKHLLASVIAGGVERSPPLKAPFAVWLSMIAVVGLASRPAFSRISRRRQPRGTRARDRRLGAPAQSRRRTPEMDVHDREGPHQNGPRLPQTSRYPRPARQRVIITVPKN